MSATWARLTQPPARVLLGRLALGGNSGQIEAECAAAAEL